MAKIPPELQKLEDILRSSKMVSHGFMGTDSRFFQDVIDADLAELLKLKTTAAQIAARMQQITDIAIPALGNWVDIDQTRQASVEEAKGLLICPWPHNANFAKRITTVKLKNSPRTIRWSDLNIHLIAEHNFFEGKGSPFRLEPQELIKMIF